MLIIVRECHKVFCATFVNRLFPFSFHKYAVWTEMARLAAHNSMALKPQKFDGNNPYAIRIWKVW